MQVVYDESFNGLVKACIISEVKGYEPVTEATLDSNKYVSINDFTMNQLFIEWDWINGTPHDVSGLENAISLALRHKSVSKELLFSIISQALKWGVDYVLTRKSFEAKCFCNKVRSVREELRNAKLGMKFINNGRTLFGRYFFSHDISNLLQQFYQKRFPDKRIVITNHADSYAIGNTRVPPRPAGVARLAPVSAPTPVTLNSFF